MITFLLSIAALILGYIFYGALVEKIFGIREDAETPATKYADGVDFVELNWKRALLIQFLNIAGTGPIFGAIAGALWGPAAFMWIVFGCIFAGAVHDYFCGMLSLRNNGTTIAEIVGKYLGTAAKYIMRVFSVVLLILVGVVFVTSPAGILHSMMENVPQIAFVAIIMVYYIIATVLPIDKVIGRIYPIFGGALLVMAIGILITMITKGYVTHIPEISLHNFHPSGKHVFPFLFITIACGAISGFHATQSPIMARCVTNEKYGRRVFYGAMIAEGIVALIWAAAAMTFYGGIGELSQAGIPAVVVKDVSIGLMGTLGGILAVLGVVACPITSGDTAFRSARLTIADALKYDQGPFKNRFVIATPLFVIGTALCFIDFDIIWRYFAWSNQTLATIALWAISAYLVKKGKFYWLTLIPSVFMTVVVVTYILIADEGLRLNYTIGLAGGIICAVVAFVLFMSQITMKHANTIGLED